MIRSWPTAIRRRLRALLEDVVALDGPQDEAPSLTLMAREATDLLDRTREGRRPKTEAALDREAENEEEDAAWRAVKDAVRIRSRGRCEHVSCRVRCRERATECDHIIGGARRKELESVEGCMDLCSPHHRLKTANSPTRGYWLSVAMEHLLGLPPTPMLRRVIEAVQRSMAIREGKRR